MPAPEQDWRRACAEYLEREARPVEKFGHQPRLYGLTLRLGEGLQYDDDIVYAAAWLHDLGVFTGHRPEEPAALEQWDMIAYAEGKVPGLLREFGFAPEKIDAVIECIRTHQPQHDPVTIEATILRDADILEQLGAVGILRTVCKVGRDTRFQTFTQAAASLERALERLPELLRLPASRALAVDRVRVHRAFLHAVQAEAGSSLL